MKQWEQHSILTILFSFGLVNFWLIDRWEIYGFFSFFFSSLLDSSSLWRHLTCLIFFNKKPHTQKDSLIFERLGQPIKWLLGPNYVKTKPSFDINKVLKWDHEKQANICKNILSNLQIITACFIATGFKLRHFNIAIIENFHGRILWLFIESIFCEKTK